MTRSELDRMLKGLNEVLPSYHKRLCELERMGAVERLGTRPCSVTGRECDEWDVTDRLPTKIEPRSTPRVRRSMQTCLVCGSEAAGDRR